MAYRSSAPFVYSAISRNTIIGRETVTINSFLPSCLPRLHTGAPETFRQYHRHAALSPYRSYALGWRLPRPPRLTRRRAPFRHPIGQPGKQASTWGRARGTRTDPTGKELPRSARARRTQAMPLGKRPSSLVATEVSAATDTAAPTPTTVARCTKRAGEKAQGKCHRRRDPLCSMAAHRAHAFPRGHGPSTAAGHAQHAVGVAPPW